MVRSNWSGVRAWAPSDQAMCGVVVDLDLQRVGAGRAGGERHGLDVAGVAGCVAGVGDDGQVGELVQGGDGVQVEGVARARLEGADAALAQHHAVVALAHDVLGRHEQLVDRSGDAAFEQHGRGGLADFLEQVEVLRVAGADLHDVDAALHEQLDVAHVHDLGDDGHTRGGLGLDEQVQPALAHALVGIRGGAGLVRAATQHRGAGRFAALGDSDEVVALDRAGAGDDLEVAAADLDAASEVDHGVCGVELAIGLFERLRDPLNALDDVHGFKQEGVDLVVSPTRPMIVSLVPRLTCAASPLPSIRRRCGRRPPRRRFCAGWQSS